MSVTKNKILQSSIELFNKHGIDAVRLQQIAEDSGISVGNLAYHFKNKEAIEESIYNELFAEFRAALGQYSLSNEMKSFDYQIESYYIFFRKYQFYIADFIKTDKNPNEFDQLWQEYISKMYLQIKSRISLFIKNENFISEPLPGIYAQLIENIWLNLIFYFQKYKMKGVEENLFLYKSSIWSQIKPYFSEPGLAEFNTTLMPIYTH